MAIKTKLEDLKKNIKDAAEEVKETVKKPVSMVDSITGITAPLKKEVVRPKSMVEASVTQPRVVEKKEPEYKEVDLVGIAKDVIRGDWGNGDDRYNRLTAAGYDYNTVQTIVNDLLAGRTPTVNTIAKLPVKEETKPVLKDVLTVAREVIRGDWGNGDDRYNRLTAAGYDYNTVQAKVNELLK